MSGLGSLFICPVIQLVTFPKYLGGLCSGLNAGMQYYGSTLVELGQEVLAPRGRHVPPHQLPVDWFWSEPTVWEGLCGTSSEGRER